jgi:Mce-associated membrane protein
MAVDLDEPRTGRGPTVRRPAGPTAGLAVEEELPRHPAGDAAVAGGEAAVAKAEATATDVEIGPIPTDGDAVEEPPTAAGQSPGSVARAALSTRSVLLLAGALVVFLILAVLFAVLDHSARSNPAAQNTAVTDVAATAEVAGQLGDALETVYSYDFARLDENERAAREVITPGFAAEFDQLFAQVRELAPQQQAVVSATVTIAAVQTIEGDRAVLVAFMDQQATRAANGEQLTAAGRLTVTGERQDGRWKIAAVHSH